jgi:RNA polymerase sigma-70 factor (ECF subfamily)
MSKESSPQKLSFRQELERAYPTLVRQAIKITGTRDGGIDLANDTIVKALRHEGKYVLGTNISGWLKAIAVNTNFSNHRTKKTRLRAETKAMQSQVVQPNQETALELQDLRRSVGELSQDERSTLGYIALNGTSRGSRKEDHTPAMSNTLKKRVFNVRNKLRSLGHGEDR